MDIGGKVLLWFYQNQPIILEERYDMVKVCLKDVCKEDEKIILTGNTV